MALTTSWKRSTQPRKQRAFIYQAPLHIRQKFIGAHLAPALREKYNLRTLAVREGDKVKVLRGQFKGQEGKVTRVSLMRGRVYIQGVEQIKQDGTKLPFPVTASNLLITELSLSDKKRKQKVELKTKKEK